MLAELPNEIIDQILLGLVTEERIKLEMTNKKLRNIMYNKNNIVISMDVKNLERNFQQLNNRKCTLEKKLQGIPFCLNDKYTEDHQTLTKCRIYLAPVIYYKNKYKNILLNKSITI